MNITATKTESTPVLVAARAGKVELNEDHDDFFADIEARTAEKGYTLSMRTSTGAVIATRAPTIAGAVRAMHFIVGEPAPSAGVVAEIQHLVAQPRGQLRLVPNGGLL